MDLKLFYNEIMNTLAKDSNGEPTLVLHAGDKRNVRIAGWPIHYVINIDINLVTMANGSPVIPAFERPVAKYDRWSGSVDFSGDESKVLHVNACWVMDRGDGDKLKILDFLGRGEHEIIDDLENYRNSYHKDPGGMDANDFQIGISEQGKDGRAAHLNLSHFSEKDRERFQKEKIRERLIEARRVHTPDEVAEIKNGTYLSRRYGAAQNNDRLKVVLEALYDISKEQNSNPVIKQQFLAEYTQITGKKHPGFWS